MNDSLYNPASMSKNDIKTLFVARQPLLDELVSTIRNQPQGAGVQHLLIISPRGMGKTTMLLMLQFAVEDNDDLAKAWQAVRFPEESYDITELADFWLKVLQYLDDEDLKPKIEEIESKFRKSEDLREAAWALVKDWSKKNKKRVVLLVDNFDMILTQIGSQNEQARLRDILMNDGTIMLIGCAPSYFEEIQDYELPLYNFFKIHNLNELKFPDIEELLRGRAKIDEIENIDDLLKRNKTRIKSLEAFTGGNPRLVLMLYRIITSSDMAEVRKGLEKLLDAVTPFYKDKTEKLPPQQRKIVNEIALYGLEKSEGISPTEIAQRIRMTPNQVSTQLKRLAENGYVKSLNIRGRSSYYALSEPLYAIWAQMRFGRNAREKRQWLVQMLKAIFDVQEIQKQIETLNDKLGAIKRNGRKGKVLGTIEYMICLMETNPTFMDKYFSIAVEGYLSLKELPSLKTELTVKRMKTLSGENLEKLADQGLIDIDKSIEFYFEKFQEAYDFFWDAIDAGNKTEVKKKLNVMTTALADRLKAIQNPEIANGILATLFVFKASLLFKLMEFDLAISEYDKAIKLLNQTETLVDLKPFVYPLYVMKIQIMLLQERNDKAAKTFREYIEIIKKSESENWLNTSIKHLTTFLDLDSIFKMIHLTSTEAEYFPFSRAIEYLRSQDESLIEILSPEVRIVVDEIVRTLHDVSEDLEFEPEKLKKHSKNILSEQLKFRSKKKAETNSARKH